MRKRHEVYVRGYEYAITNPLIEDPERHEWRTCSCRCKGCGREIKEQVHYWYSACDKCLPVGVIKAAAMPPVGSGRVGRQW